jgi:poly(A) polymerase
MSSPLVLLSPELDGPARRRALYAVGHEAWCDLVLSAWARGHDKPEDAGWRDLLAEAEKWPRPRFPLTGQDVKQLGIGEGAVVGEMLHAAETWWIENDFRAGRDECLAWLARQAG